MFGITLRHVETGQQFFAVSDDLQKGAHMAWEQSLKWYAQDPLNRRYCPIMDTMLAAGAASECGVPVAVGDAWDVDVAVSLAAIEVTPAGWSVIEGGAQQAWGK